mmetsp:Transcript_52040/g.156170  ORF Transcript_52040/g.156170 Transcript_52040/m.156170 type:complete len:84 (+) Transcript_52040:2661-2912(+)
MTRRVEFVSLCTNTLLGAFSKHDTAAGLDFLQLSRGVPGFFVLQGKIVKTMQSNWSDFQPLGCWDPMCTQCVPLYTDRIIQRL